MKSKYVNIIILGLVTLFVLSCANSITPPVGGPKDEDPPKVLETIPENGRPNFKTDRFSIRFNEFVKLENIQQSALISPPMEELPEFKIKGKSILVKFNEELKPNTTYSVYFGDAITDITEGNPLSNYTYIFSTGDYVDSLSLYGSISNAFDLIPVEGAFVCLYKDNNDTIEFDSLPFLVPPYYISKTDVNGRFQFSGLSDDDFFLMGLMDQNSNFFFDQPGEEIAFIDSLVHPYYMEKPLKDTLTGDSIADINIESDTITIDYEAVVDSLFEEEVLSKSIELYMFLSRDTIQRLLKSEVLEKNKIRFSFSQPANNVTFERLTYPLDDSLLTIEYTYNKDTIYWHLNNPPIDSLELLITENADTLGHSYLKLDPSKKSRRVERKEEEIKENLSWSANITKVINPDQQLEIKFGQPNVTFNNIDSSLLIYSEDTIYSPEFKFIDNGLSDRIVIPFKPVEEYQYHIFFPDSSFTSWNGINTDEISLNLKTLPTREYGTFVMHLRPEKVQNYIIQMLDDKETVLNEQYFTGDTTLIYDYLQPMPLKFKLIYDDNNNKVWDTGDLGKRIQPEKVIYFPKEIATRANWEVEEEWSF